MDGLNQAADIFLRRFRVTRRGMRRAHWVEDQAQLKSKIVCIAEARPNFPSKVTDNDPGINSVGRRDVRI